MFDELSLHHQRLDCGLGDGLMVVLDTFYTSTGIEEPYVETSKLISYSDRVRRGTTQAKAACAATWSRRDKRASTGADREGSKPLSVL